MKKKMLLVLLAAVTCMFVFAGCSESSKVSRNVSGADVDKYHYEINFLPKWGAKITHKQ